MIVRTTGFAALLAVLAAGCVPAGGPAEPAASSPADDEEHGPKDHVDVPPTVRQNLGIGFATVELRRVAETVRLPGAFELQPLARHEYRMALPGRVDLRVDQHDRVQPGDLLFRYLSPAWPELLHEIIHGEQAIAIARGEIEVGQARIHEARRRLAIAYKRIATLAEADFRRADLEAAAEELEASVPRHHAELRLAETRLANARRTREHALHRAATSAGLTEEELEREVEHGDERVPAYRTMNWIEVRAAEPGVVEALFVTDGSFVDSHDAVLATVDLERVRFRALGLQADLPRLLEAEGARVVPPQSPGFAIDAGVAAELTIGLEAHPEARTLTLYATPEGLEPWIRPGVSAFLEIVLDWSHGPALAVPRAAVVQDGEQHVVFRRDPDDPDTVLRTPTRMGVGDGRWVVLEEGVVEGDEVVLDGAYELELITREGDLPAPVHDHDHPH